MNRFVKIGAGASGEGGANSGVLGLKQLAQRHRAFRVARRCVDDVPGQIAEWLGARLQDGGEVRVVEETQDGVLRDLVGGEFLRRWVAAG